LENSESKSKDHFSKEKVVENMDLNNITTEKETSSSIKILFTQNDNQSNQKTNMNEGFVSKQNFSLSTDSGFKSELVSSSSSSSFCDNNCDRNSKNYKQQVSGTSEESIPIIIDYNNQLNKLDKNLNEETHHIKPLPIKIENNIKIVIDTENSNREDVENPILLGTKFSSKFQPRGAVFRTTLANKNKKEHVKPKTIIRLSRSSSTSSSSNGIDFETLENLEKKQKEEKTYNSDKLLISISPTDYLSTSSMSSTSLSNNLDSEAFFTSQPSSPNSVKAEFSSQNKLKEHRNLKDENSILVGFTPNKSLMSSTSFTPISPNELYTFQKSKYVVQTALIPQVKNIDGNNLYEKCK
jgi:hypothetical protein